MLQASLHEVRTVGLAGLKAHWKISKPEDSVTVDGDVYVRVSAASYTLMSIVCDDRQPQRRTATMASNKGLAQLITRRNETQAAYLSEAATDGQCSLFERPNKKARPVQSRHEQEALRKSPKSMMLELKIDGVPYEVEVLRPVHPKDNLFVAYRADVLAPLLHFMRDAGFDDHTVRDQHLPKGIQTRKKGYVVKYNKGDGSHGFKSMKTLADALAFHAEPIIHDGIEDAISEDEVDRDVDGVGTI